MSSQSSLFQVINIINTVQTYLYRFVSPFIIFMGTVGCILNIIIFTQKTLRKNPCSIYFITYNLANLFYIYASLLFLTLDGGYSINPKSQNLVLCRLCIYFSFLFSFLSSSFLILAAIDRIFITSSNALTRQRSTLDFAYVSVSLITLFWTISFSHLLILTDIIEMAPHFFLCFFQLGVYFAVMNNISFIKEILVFILLIIFGLWCIKNVRNIRRIRIIRNLSQNPTISSNNSSSTSSKDRQLMLILLIDIGIYALFNSIFVIFLIQQQVTQNSMKSFEEVQLEGAISKLCFFCQGMPFCTSFYTSLIVSKTFRNETKKVFKQIRRIHIR